MRVVPGPLWWNLAGSLAILLGLGGLAFGLPAVDRAVPASRPVAGGQPYPVGAGVTVVPPDGALLDLTGTRPAVNRGRALFLLGGVRYLVAVGPFAGDLPAAAAQLRRRITGNPGYQVTGSESAVRTAAGLSGLQGSYTAAGRGGRYAVFLVAGLSVEITASGTDLQLSHWLEAIEASIHSLDHRRPR